MHLRFLSGLLVGLLGAMSPAWCDDATQPSVTTNPVTQAVAPADSYQAFVQRVDQATDKKDLAAMRGLAEECERQWRQEKPVWYARGLAYLSGSLSTYDFKSKTQDGLSQEYALEALRNVPNLPNDIRLRLLGHMQGWTDEKGEKIVGPAWTTLREEQARLWLGAMRDLKARIDPSWDPKQITGMHNLPPSVAGRVIFGQDAASISDPKLRAEYAAAVEKDRADTAKYNEQYWLRKYRVRYLPMMEKYLAIAYARSPIDLEQLEHLMKQYDLEPSAQGRILTAVKALVATEKGK